MSSISTLADEILLQIVSLARPSPCHPQPTLNSLALISRRLYECSDPELYRFVHHVGFGQQEHHYHAPGSDRTHEWLCDSNASSAIFDVSVFLRIIEVSRLLRSLVKGACFKWETVSDSQFDLVCHRILDVLAPSVDSLCLMPPHTGGFMGLPIVSLDAGWCQGNIDTMYALFVIPTLRNISITDAWRWNDFGVSSNIERKGTPYVESIFLRNTTPAATCLENLLAWPKALKRLLVQDVDSNRSPWLSPRDVASALHIQCATLEELRIIGPGRARMTNGTIDESLKEFAALKRLAVPTNHLVMLDAEFKYFTRHLAKGKRRQESY